MLKQQNLAQGRKKIHNSQLRDKNKSFNGSNKNVTLEKQISLFNNSWQIESVINLMKPLSQGLSEGPLTQQTILEVSNATCKIIFSTPGTKMEVVELCCNNFKTYFVEHSNFKKQEYALTQVLMTVFTKKLLERFMFKIRLKHLLKERQIPEEKREKWLQRQYDIQGKLLKETDSRSVYFLKVIFKTRALLFYKLLQVLLTMCVCSDKDLTRPTENIYDYIDTMLRETSPNWIEKSEELIRCFQSLKPFAEENCNFPDQTRNLLAKHAAIFDRYSRLNMNRLQMRNLRGNNPGLVRKN